jgi:hypothetical protein
MWGFILSISLPDEARLGDGSESGISLDEAETKGEGGSVGLLRHDFWLSAVRNMERAGVPRSVAMRMTGHKMESVYWRCAIAIKPDIQNATCLLLGHKTGTIPTSSVDTSYASRQYSY